MTAVTAAAEASPRLDMGRVVKTTFGAVKGNLVVFGLMSIVLIAAPMTVVEVLATAVSGSAVGSGAASAVNLLGRIVNVVGTCVLTSAVIYGTREQLAGRKPSLGRSIGMGWRDAAKVFGINFVTGFCIVLGLFLLLVPGVFLALRWSLAAPAGVVERLGANRAMARSAALTQNNRLRILGLAVALFLAVFIAFLVVGVLMVLAVSSIAAVDEAVGVLVEDACVGVAYALLWMFLGVGLTVTYAELRSMREGVLPDQLASVFD